MKPLVLTLLALFLAALTWYSLGWIAFLVVPSMALFALMTFAPLLTDWEQREKAASVSAAAEKQSVPC